MSDGRGLILAGDIGGTHCRLAVFSSSGDRLERVWERTYPSREQRDLVALVRATAGESRAEFSAASFGIAGPVRDGRVRATNLPWTVDAAGLASALGLPHVGLLNDLEANAWGIAALPASDLQTLHAGFPDSGGNAALIAAGTGLGEAGLYWDGERHHPFASEGGHADFAPADDLQLELRGWLSARFGHVSWERVVSGPGLLNLYGFLRETRRGEEPPWLAERIAAGDPAAAIAEAAMEDRSDLAVQALDLFVRLYGAEAGNLALKVLSTGGVYLGGGIAPKIAAWLQRPPFLEGFLDKGRMRPLLESMPVRVILNDRTGLLGAARHAARSRP